VDTTTKEENHMIEQERLEKFWKRCGLIIGRCACGHIIWAEEGDKPNHEPLPPLTLDNLFKYAVPAAKIYAVQFWMPSAVPDGYACEVFTRDGRAAQISEKGEADTPADALFLALEKAINPRDDRGIG